MKKSLVSAFLLIGLLNSGVLLANEALAKSKNCLACHALDKPGVGPAYKKVAEKYAGQKDAEAQLVQKVLKGGAGVWGAMAMPPNPGVSPEEAKTLVQWILGLK